MPVQSQIRFAPSEYRPIFTGGHTHANWGDDNQRKVVLNAILWIAKARVPRNGVESAVTPEQLAANFDPKGKK